MKATKRILTVKIKRMVDDSPDTSWLGEYSNKAETEYAIDRKHSLECLANTPIIYNPNTLYECGICYSLHRWEFDGECREDSERFVDVDDYEKQFDCVATVLSWEDRQNADNNCSCGERGDIGRNEFRYFNACTENYEGEEPEDIRKYVRQDYERMKSLNAGHWCFIGIRAEAEIGLPVLANKGCVHGHEVYYTHTQKITSGGLWGIESDSDKSDLESVEKDELSDLREQLKALGFSSRAISTAFKNVEREDY